MEKKVIWVVAVSFLVASCFFIPPTTQAQTTKTGVIHWKGQTCFASTVAPYGPFGAQQTGVYGHIRTTCDWIQKASGGRLLIDLAEPGAIFPITESDTAVGKNVVQIVFAYGGYYGGRIPETDVETGGVFLFEDEQQDFECLHKYGFYQALQKVYAKRNIQWAPLHSNAVQGIATTFPAPNPDSFKGKKIRGVGMWGDYIRMLGGNPVATPWGEIYMAMKLGTIDGACVGAAALEELKLKEVAKGYVYPPTVSVACGGVLMNMDAFKALPPDLQGLLERDMPYVTYATSSNWHNQCVWVLKHAEQKYGVKLYAWSTEDINRLTQKAMKEIYPNIAKKSKDSAELLEIVYKQMRDYGRIK